MTDALLDKCKPIAGTPEDCIAAIEEYREAGCTHVMLELWGEDRHRQLELFGERVLPHVAMIDERRLGRRSAIAGWSSTPSLHRLRGGRGRAHGRDELARLGLQVQWQQVEDGRANVLGTWPGEGGGPSLMFNGHMDTSYSGREPWLQGIPGFQPEGFEQRRAHLRARHLEHEGRARLLRRGGARAADAGVRLRGDLLIAAVCGEIEKAQ